MPSATSASQASTRSPTESEFASPVVPKIAEPVAAGVEQSPAVRGERLPVDREVVAHRRQGGGEDALHTTSPCRTVFSVTTRGSTNCSRYAGPPAFVPVPDSRLPPNGWRPTIAPVISRLTYRLPTGERSVT